jgi:hypothetical protein
LRAMVDGRQFPHGSRIENLQLSGVHLHGADLEGARFTDAYFRDAEISGDIKGLRINDVDIEPLVQAELDRQFPQREKLRATCIEDLRSTWSMLEGLWTATTERASHLPLDYLLRRVDHEWSFVETLRHLIFATDSWLSRGVQLARHPYHPWGLPWSGVEPQSARKLGLDISATPGLDQVLPIRLERQHAVRAALASLTESELAEVRTAPDEPGHPNGEHSVLHCVHVILNEEWEHHRYAVRDLAVLES